MRLDGLVAEASLQGLGLLVEVIGDPAAEVSGVTMDSRQVTPGFLFACVPGLHNDGHAFASAAVAEGASALLCERRLDVAAPQVLVTSVREALGPMCDALFGHPSRDLTMVAVTGTNGKTTTVAFLAGIFEAHGWATTTIGTLTQQRTTPEAPELQALLAGWRDSGGRAVAMEVSSHALEQHRADAVSFAAGIFTNLTPEHLDYHADMDSYFEAKARLFEQGRVGRAVINRDSPWGVKLIERVRATGGAVDTFAAADVEDLSLSPGGSSFTWAGTRIDIRVGGRHNVDNALAAAACARSLGISTASVRLGLARVTGIRGRFELVDAGQPFTVIVDYAHTPDGLAKVLGAAREVCLGRLIVVFGAGGDRDHEKRPLMGAVVSELADLAVITSDNPRTEDPDAIIAEVRSGVAGGPAVVQPDRRVAIETALANAQSGDVVVIAGKGHEVGQEAAGRVTPFDDVQVARDALVRIMASRQGDG